MKDWDIMVNMKTDCRYFRGDRPCDPHKQTGAKCGDCPEYDKTNERILIIKLGAAGDVIRTTPLLRKIKSLYPQSEITWLTHYPELLPMAVDHRLVFNLENILWLQTQEFSRLYNLDKDKEACALTTLIQAKEKRGFALRNGKCSPIDKLAFHKWETGIWDDVNRENKKSYPEEIFEIGGFEFKREKYILEVQEHKDWPEFERPLIGLNTGCGERWETRGWPKNRWTELATELREKNFGVLLLGGPREDDKNKSIEEESGALYLGNFEVNTFIDLVNQCDLVVTAVTLALHIAIGLNKKVLLFNNVFNKNEFELYGLGKIMEPDVSCLGCYRSECDLRFDGQTCMELINPQEVAEKCQKLLQT